MNYRIGLDIGITSVGWAVINHNEIEEPNHIIDLGVRCFDVAEVPKTGASLASGRREARGSRRRLRRRRHRLDRIKLLFEEVGLIKVTELEEIFNKSLYTNVYEIRNKALSEKISNEEYAVILYHISKHRGFKSNRKSELSDDDMGKLLKATLENKKLYEENQYLSIGQMFYYDSKFKSIEPDGKVILITRNKAESYSNTISRDMLANEVRIIFEKQRSFNNEFASKDFEEKYMEIFLSQRPYDLGPGQMPNGNPSPYGGNLIEKMIGKCTFEKSQERACKASYSFEYFSLLQGVNNIKIKLADSTNRKLNEEERKQIIEYAHKNATLDYSKIRKLLKLDDDMSFSNLSYGNKEIVDVEKKTNFNFLKAFHEIRKVVDKIDKGTFDSFSIDELNHIGRTLTVYKNDDSRKEKLKEINLTNDVIDEVINLNFSKTGNLSTFAMNKIIPYLEQGCQYNESCEKAGYNFNGTNNSKRDPYLNTDILNDIPNPVVCRAISQSIKVINSIIRKYGSPQLICIELAREMAKNFDERKKIDKAIKENLEKNEKAKEIIGSLGVINPSGFDIVKYKLWKEQNEICAYSGKHINIGDLFDKNAVDIDHIIPYSISFDDSYKNKVLVYSEENRQKGNRLPYEYLVNDEEKWHRFEIFVSSIRDYEKRLRLLKSKVSEEDKSNFKERNLQDTKYITSQLFNYINKNLQFAESIKYSKKNVRTINGAITSYLRKNWGLTKIREEGDKHHALDAVVVACATDGMIHKISRYVKGRELKFSRNKEIIDEVTGEIIDMSKISRGDFDEIFGVKFPEPWDNFRTELEIKMGDNPGTYKSILEKIGTYEEIKPIFVSRMPKHSVSGAGHKDTIRSPKIINEGYVITKTKLKDIKWNKKENEIEGYYNKESDKLLYEALCERLKLFDYNAKEAFEEPFRKPKSDGTDGPIVKKVKIIEKQTLGVVINDGKGVAANGDMIRIDVFNENGKYYFVPIYAADTIKKNELPNKAVIAHKKYSDWKVMKEEDFIFSLYSRDLIIFKNKNGSNGKNIKGEKVIVNEIPMYYYDANISKASIGLKTHDKSIEIDTLYIQNLEYLKKLHVDVLGNMFEVNKEKRIGFNL